MAKYLFSVLSVLLCIQSVISISDGNNTHCEEPPKIERSRPCKKHENYPVGKIVKYCCDHGFRLSDGVRTATCTFDGTEGVARWNGPHHRCQAVSCSPPDQIENGRIKGSQYTFPNSVKYECKKGYELRGLATLFCETTGEWSGRAPRCQAVTCPKPETIEKGKVTYSSTKYLSTAKYECENGYRVQGISERRCTHEGVWEGDEPTCIEAVCPEPKDPVNGKVIVHDGTRLDNLISFTCDEGTQLVGASFAKCMEDGTWSANPPLCSKPCVVPRLGRGKMGTLELTSGWRSQHWTFIEVYPGEQLEHNKKLLLRCNRGFELPVDDLEPGDIEVVCDNGAFNPVPACHPAWCRGPLPNNGRGIPPPPPYSKEDGSLIEYRDSCVGIGAVVQKKTALCVTGTWIVTDEICHDPRCKAEDLDKFNVRANGNEFYPDGEVLEVQCKGGFKTSSENRILCQNGEWQVSPSLCKAAPCNYSPPDIDNGNAHVSSHEHGVSVSYTCFPPYRLVPRGTVFCSHGQWIGTLPACETEPCTVPKLYRGKMGTMQQTSYGSLIFKERKFGTSVQSGDKLLLRCNDEFELPVEDLPPGDIEVICDGGVLKPKPSCHPAWCRGPLPDDGKGVPPSPPYNKENGSVVVYKDSCSNIGGTLQEKRALCVRGSWIVTDEVCEDLRCKARDLDDFFVDTNGQEFFASGEVIEVRCKIGYEKTREDTIPCINGQWKITSAPCKAAFCRYSPPEIDYGKATVSFGEHGTSIDYTCSAPYELVSKGSVTCSYGQWLGTLPVCKDTRCHTFSLSVYDGVKAENKTIKNNELYTPSCHDGYDSLEAKLRCVKGTWAHSERHPRFCIPGNCKVPYVAHGDFYTIEITKYLFYSDSRELVEVPLDSTITHNTVLQFKCRGAMKFQGKTKTDGEGIEVTCRLKQWTPKPECWYFPQTTTTTTTTIMTTPIITTTMTTTTTETTTQSQIDNEKINNIALENNTLVIETNKTEKEEEVVHNIPSHIKRKNCKYEKNDDNLLLFFEDRVTLNDTLPDGSTIKFGCQPIGSHRLHGVTSSVCDSGEWMPNEFPKCLRPLKKEEVTVSLYTDKTYETRPGDVALVWKDSVVEINCYNLVQRSRFPQLSHGDSSKNIVGERKVAANGFQYSSIRVEKMSEEYVGTYKCSYGTDSHSITLKLADTEGKTFCPSVNATDDLLINYDPGEEQILPGTRATFFCRNAMSKLQGEKEIICLNSGTWSNSPPICVGICWPAPDIENGYKDGDSNFVGSEVTYGCHRGYRLIGRSKLRCNENKYWSHNLPRCSEIRCRPPASVANANIDYSSLRFNAIVEYRCKSGYRLVGNSTSRCNENGEWTNRPPVCQDESAQCNSYDLSDNLPESVFAKNITEERMPTGSVIELVCGHTSEIIIGDKYAFCTSAGHWKVGSTKCVLGCIPLEKANNSTLIIEGIKETYRFGDYVTFSCPGGERLSMDLEVIFCLRTGWSDSRMPECLPPNP